jgi:hypothetical protein
MQAMPMMHPPPPSPPIEVLVDSQVSSWVIPLITSVVSAGVLLFIWWRTQEGNRKNDEARRNAEAVAALMRETRPIMSRAGTPEERIQRRADACAAVAAELIVFSAIVIPNHEPVGGWALKVGVVLQGFQQKIRRTSNLSELKEQSAGLGQLLGALGNELTRWLRDKNDDRFKTLAVPDGPTVDEDDEMYI